METINSIMDFICSWHGYFIMMPIWFIVIIIFIKLCKTELLVADIIPLLLGCLVNPLLSLCTIIVVVLVPFIFISFYIEEEWGWDKIGKKKLF